MGVERGPHDYYSHGDWNVVCSMCGRKVKFSETERNWQGLYRHWYCNEPRQPQDFARGIAENMNASYVLVSAPYSSAPAAGVPTGIDFVLTCSLNGISAMPGAAMPGCMLPGSKTFNPEGL
jgi:hypothetical protein